MTKKAKHAGIITAVVVLIVSAFWFGLGIGLNDNDEPEKPLYTYGEAESGAYWCEIYDDGRVIIHTEQQWLTNDNKGNIVILTETMEPIE